MANFDDGLMTLGETARYLRVSTSTLYRIVTGRRPGVAIPFSRVGNGWRFSRVQLDSWMRQLSTERPS